MLDWLARGVLRGVAMYEFVQLRQIKARLGELVVEFQLLHHAWPIEPQRRSIERSISWILRSVTQLVSRLDERPIDSYDKRLARVVHDAYLSVYVAALQLIPELEKERVPYTKLPSTERVSTALSLLQDLIEPACEHADGVLGYEVLVTLKSYEATDGLPLTAV